MKRDPVQPGQESVWDYPRPPRLESTARRVAIAFDGETIVDTTRALRVLETSHPPVYYVLENEVVPGRLVRVARGSFCEWKGRAHYFDLVGANGKRASAAAWGYAEPTTPFEALAAHVAFYAAPMDACFVDGERVTPQPGGFYGGWVTKDLAGPFKGVPGSMGW